MQYKSHVLKFVIYKNGTDGKGLSNIKNYYLVSSKSTGITTESEGWTEDVASLTLTAENNYLWNYEEVSFSDGSTSSKTEPCIIGMYSEDGVGIEGITEYYGLSKASDVQPTQWKPSEEGIPTMTAEQKYLWNYETTNYTDGTNFSSIPCVVGVYGDTGDSQMVMSADAPSDTSKLWLDTSVTPNVLRQYDKETGKWVPVNEKETKTMTNSMIMDHGVWGVLGYDADKNEIHWMKYVDGVLKLGVPGSKFTGQFTNQELAFLDGEGKASWISNRESWANVMQAKSRLSVGIGADADGSDDRLSLVDEGELGYSLM